MNQRLADKKVMPDVQKLDFQGALAEIWSQINSAAYHLGYVRVYSQSEALRTRAEMFRKQAQHVRDHGQVDIVICRSHLAAFFWSLEHIFEALRAAITLGQKEYAKEEYFWGYEKQLDEMEKLAIRQEIRSYRNMAHQNPAIIGCGWDSEGKFLHHFLPTINGHQPQEDVEMNARLQWYFEFAVNIWLKFVPENFKKEFPRDFCFPVTIPHLFGGELPSGLNSVPQLEVHVVSSEPRSTQAECQH